MVLPPDKIAPSGLMSFSGGEKAAVAILRRLGFEVISTSAVPEQIPYIAGRTYHRKNDIHDIYGGQERGGIATPQDSKFVFLFTGESGETYGYQDGWQPDGSFYYTGEGQLGICSLSAATGLYVITAKMEPISSCFRPRKPKGNTVS